MNSRFEGESKLRKELVGEQLRRFIDEDMAHILAALLGEGSKKFYSHYRKDLDKLVEELKRNENTIENETSRHSGPVYKSTLSNSKDTHDGKLACGYLSDDYSKGMNQILNCLSDAMLD
jgi:hypothetical protein